MKYAWLVLVVLLGACSVKPLSLPGQEAAVRVVWEGLYGETHAPPIIHWVMSPNLDCFNHEGFFVRKAMTGSLTPLCVAGVYWRELYATQVAWPKGTQRFYQTALAHELLHALLHIQGMDPDPDHQHEWWGMEYGKPFGKLDEARALLASLDY